MAFKWSRELIEKLITCVEEKQCIYNVKSKDYLDREKKAKALNNILKDLEAVESSITFEEIKRKWKNLRTQYGQELRKTKQSKKSGAGTNDIYVPKLWCFQHLNFLQAHTDIRESKSNIEIATQDSQSDLNISQEESSLDESLPPRKMGSSAVNVILKEVENFKTIFNNRKSKKKFAWLGNLVACRMEDIHPGDQYDAAWQIQCLMQKLCTQSAERKRSTSISSVTSQLSDDGLSCSTSNKVNRKHTQSISSDSRDLLELSMEGVFDDDDFVE